MGVVATTRSPRTVNGGTTLSAWGRVSLALVRLAGGVAGGATSSGLPSRGVEGLSSRGAAGVTGVSEEVRAFAARSIGTVSRPIWTPTRFLRV